MIKIFKQLFSYFNEQQQKIKHEFKIENAEKRSKDAVSEAIGLINQSKTHVLNKVEPQNTNEKTHLLEYYTPENEELYKYLIRYNHKFTSNNDVFLIINKRHDFDKAVETLKYYDKYADTL